MSWGAQLTPLPFALQALKAAGVTEVILAINYRPEVRWCAGEGPILPPTADCVGLGDTGRWEGVVRRSLSKIFRPASPPRPARTLLGTKFDSLHTTTHNAAVHNRS